MNLELAPLTQKFVLHWGEMAARWGVSRSVAQIQALLYLSERPLNAEEIAETLSIARSNVSTSLKELQAWNLIKVTHVLGDRRDHFETIQDITHLFRVIVDERKRRELDPTLALLREWAADREMKASPFVKDRIKSTLDFLELLNGWYEEMKKLPHPLLIALLRMGGKLRGMLKNAA